ncbi:hypothetical protein [Candidatus Uabimicrobium sp. HlEnr_7]|uniref:hypothetical protein n=1 Tax=Candidatus Uabimicrobium helgolandensis TaxID=3095367 RepID=UPI00355865E7
MNAKKAIISLTGEKSHSINISPGQGSFSIGTMAMNAKKFDILVDEKLPLNWKAFEQFSTPAGSPWPRFFYYYGNDCGFIEWSLARKIETFYWHPLKSLSVDCSNAQISSLSIKPGTNKIEITLGEKIKTLVIDGDIENVHVISTKKTPSLTLYPITSKEEPTAHKLPTLKTLKNLTSLDITVKPVGQPFDCRSLLQFKNLTHLNLSGNLENIDCLRKLGKLDSLGLRFVPNLENLPPLQEWKNLKSFIAWNVEAISGKRIRAELKKLVKEREFMKYSSVSQLRDSIWFTTEYGIPFCGWKGKNAKTAIKSYKATVKKLKKAKTQKEIKKIMSEYVDIFNRFENIETVEREDIAISIEQLIGVPSFQIDVAEAMQWFDEIREF